jgi:hypothetical protein
LSHIVSIKTEVRDIAAIQAACRRLQLMPAVHGKTQLFGGEVEGWAVRLPDWQYPVVCDTAAGKIHYDDFGGRWGEKRHLDRFLQMYATERAKIEARKRGHLCFEQTLADGSIKLTIQVQGGAA